MKNIREPKKNPSVKNPNVDMPKINHFFIFNLSFME